MRILVSGVALLVPAVAAANGYLVPNTSPRDLGLAETTVSATEGPEATYVNTATLSEHMGLGVMLSGSIIDFTSTWIDPTHTSPNVTTQTQYGVPIVAALSYGLKLADHGLGFGASINNPGGGRVYWPESWPGATSSVITNRSIFQVTAGAGFEIIPQVKIGASFIYMQMEEQVTAALPFDAGTSDFGLSGGRPTFAVSVAFTPVKDLEIGAQYQHLVEMLLNGNVHFANVPTALQSSLVDQTVKSELTFPDLVTAGISYKFFDCVRLLFAYQFTRFDVYQQDQITGQLTGFTATVARDYTNSNSFKFAAEIFPLPFLRLFVGGRYDQSPQPTDTLSPTLPDSPAWSVSGGGALDLVKFLSLFAAYQYTWFNQVTAEGPNAFPATYQTHAQIGSVGLQFRWK